MADPGQTNQETRDNFGRRDESANPVFIFGGPIAEFINVEEGPSVLSRNNIGNSFVLGHATNGIIGASGKKIGKHDYIEGEFDRVVNPGNTFHEHFRYSDFNDSDVTTANFSTTNYNVSFDDGELFQSKEIFINSESILSVTPVIKLDGGSTTFTIDTSEGGNTVTITEGSESE